MEVEVAVKLIGKGVSGNEPQSWVDLGAGSGLFTTALSQLLPAGSSILAIDKKISKISVADNITLQTKAGDFLTTDIGAVDGVVMANSLHYVEDQTGFLRTLKTKRLILVEYDTDKSNQWVPYPISFRKLKSIYPSAELIGKESSAYHKEGMYAALLLF